MRFSHLICFFSCALVVLGGECLTDSNTGQSSSAWSKYLWSYVPTSAKSASSSTTLNFMTYNLQSSISNACVSNPQAQAQLMSWADFVGNNEVVQGVDTRCNHCVMEQIIADTTGFNTRFVMTFPWRTGQYGIGSGTSQQIVDTQYHLYSYSGAEQRALFALKTRPAGLNGNYLWFITTHVDYTVAAAREAEVSQLIQWVRSNIIANDAKASVVVVGDFNAGPWDPMYNNMKTLFKNAWEVYSGSIDNGNTYPSNAPSVRFDHIWYYVPSGFTATPTYVEIVNSQDSDHRPLRASIKFTTPGSASTPAPSTHAPATPAPATPAPAKGSTSAPATPAPSSGTCTASVSYNLSGNNIVIRNTGSKAIKSISLHISSLPENHWNLVASSTSDVYNLPGFAYQSLGVGQTYSSSGFWSASTLPTITVQSVSC